MGFPFVTYSQIVLSLRKVLKLNVSIEILFKLLSVKTSEPARKESHNNLYVNLNDG